MDCYQLFCHPAFHALLPLLGVPSTTDVLMFVLRMSRHDMPPEVSLTRRVTVGHVNTECTENVPPPPTNCFEVYQSREFGAFAEAVGFAWGLHTIGVTFRAPGEGQTMEIIHTYRATISTPEDPNPVTVVG